MPLRPTRAEAKGASGETKFVITAPFITVGSRPVAFRIQPIMPVVVDLPLVPATPMLEGAALNSSASSAPRGDQRAAQPPCGLDVRHRLLDRGRGDDDLRRVDDAAAVLREQRDAAGAQEVEFRRPCGPGRRARSEPATAAPCSLRMSASGSMPLPPMPQKK